MRLVQLAIETFRNHFNTLIDFSETGNIILGNNGEGKTNIIEAISCLCLTKSFFTPSDAIITMFGQPGYTVSGIFKSDCGIEYKATISYTKVNSAKIYSLNRKKIDHLSNVIGLFPVVIVSPEHAHITFGGPQERRKFIDGALSQTHRLYLETLLEYRQILKQRNVLLMNAREKNERIDATIDPWNEAFARTGTLLLVKRKEFVSEFRRYFEEAFAQITESAEKPSIEYQCTLDIGDASAQEEIEVLFKQSIAKHFVNETKMGFSLIGPHRDELLFSINGSNLRMYASQGQHKSFLVALKMAEFSYIREKCKETPILLLDDVLSELDTRRATNLLKAISSAGQFALTSTERDFFAKFPQSSKSWKIIEVKNGSICYAN
ncbi:MAG: DNA replication and repair protein RecF [Bacteroidetes bacterium]|nr:DNA replication and repair protein RecF [Bacteroidota bacterium]